MRHVYQLWACHRQNICRMDLHSTLPVPYMESHMLWLKIHKWNFLVVDGPNWEQFFIYLHFNCTAAWIHTYLVLLYPKDQMITLKTQKYLIKLNHLANLNNKYAEAQQSFSHHIHRYTVSPWLFLETWSTGSSFEVYIIHFCHYNNGIK